MTPTLWLCGRESGESTFDNRCSGSLRQASGGGLTLTPDGSMKPAAQDQGELDRTKPITEARA